MIQQSRNNTRYIYLLHIKTELPLEVLDIHTYLELCTTYRVIDGFRQGSWIWVILNESESIRLKKSNLLTRNNINTYIGTLSRAHHSDEKRSMSYTIHSSHVDTFCRQRNYWSAFIQIIVLMCLNMDPKSNWILTDHHSIT